MREVFVRLHRWVGLATLLFLIVAGATGAVLAWNDELDAWLAPELLLTPPASAGKPLLAPAVLRDIVVQAYPEGRVLAIPLARPPGKTVPFPVWMRDATAAPPQLVEVFIDPATGVIQGDRRWGDLSQGRKNLVSFIHRLHTSLLAGSIGEWVLGVVALLWSLDCVVGALLTLPARLNNRSASRLGPARPARSWWARWRPAWMARLGSGGYKLGFDLHRAAGLWLWLALFGMAWSSVAFNLPGVYQPVMAALFEQQPDLRRSLRQTPAQATGTMSWQAALETGRRHMAAQADSQAFAVRGEHWLAYDPRANLYRYTVRSTLDIRTRSGATHVFFNASDGALRGAQLPSGQASGDTITLWLTSLHMAALWGWPLKLAVSLLGMAVLLLCVTGWIIWRKKARARAVSRARHG